MCAKIIFFLSILFLAGCGGSTPITSNKTPQKPLVFVSIAPYKFLVEEIGQGAIEVRTIIPLDSNPHTYEPTSKQALEIMKGQIWFRIGEPFENKVLSLTRERNPALAVYDLRDQLELLSFGPETCCAHNSLDHLDRHVWLSPKFAGKQAEMIAAVLIERFPEKKEEFKKNLERCLSKLVQLDDEIDTLLKPLQKRVLLVSHPAFGYFCHEYHLEQLSVEQDGKEPRPRHLEEIMDKAKQGHADIALTLPQYNNKGAQLIAERLNIPVRMINPYSFDYFETMRSLARLIADPQGIREDAP
jgi:zinc transport system substrate-binding protein